ncbi:hypothetical protein [Salinisphaera sp. T5B8]|uniref:hypothetical protein n=1 Tax=Salinisphaera sp. T5B8 TaxID=1304154 RepID=UPI003340DA31
MRGRRALIAGLRLAVAMTLALVVLPALGNPRADKPTARDYLVFSTVLTADCMRHRGQLRQIANSHAKRAIRVVLMAYTGATRAQSPSEFTLAPRSEPRALGCDRVSGLARRWQVEKAKFVTRSPGTQ